MSDRDRLAELLRQRALILEHLAWLDREIQHASGAKPASLPALQPPAVATALVAAALKAKSSAPADEPPVVAGAADAILAEYRVPPSTLKNDIRKGCLLYFAAALGLVALIVAALWFVLRRE